MKLTVINLVLLFSKLVLSGPVNSFDGFPVASMNRSGDFVLAGNLKSYVRWNGHFVAVQTKLSRSSKAHFSGGIASRGNRSGAPAAIICAENAYAVFYPKGHLGRWELKSVDNSHLLKCSMLTDGTWAILNLTQGEALLSNGKSIKLNVNTQNSTIVNFSNHFLIISGKSSYLINREGRVKTLESPFGNSMNEFSRVDGNSTTILKVDDYGSYVVTKNGVDELGFPLISKKKRLPVSPCSENQACGVSVAHDNSWLLSGYWGTWIGSSHSSKRLKIANSSREFGGVAIAHSGNGGRFVYAANDDGDMGTLPIKDLTVLSTPQESVARHAVWLKGHKEIADYAGLIVPNVKYSEKLSGPVVVFDGQLPQEIPDSWLYWEPETKLTSVPHPVTTFEADGLWWIDSIKRDQAWEYALSNGMKAEGVLVSVVDSGIDLDHKDLQYQLSVNLSEIAQNSVDDDLNGLVDDIIGYDFVKEDPLPEDLFGHGTHVAGLISGGEDFAIGKNSSLLVARALGRSGKSNSIDLSRAVTYSVDRGSRLINCSWGGGSVTEALKDAFTYAYDNDVMVFTSSGNSGLNHDKSPQVPGEFPGVVSVGAYTSSGKRAKFSNFGQKSVAFMAPGDNILSTIKGGEYGLKSGTSMASPIAVSLASWVMGLILGEKPDISQKNLVGLTYKVICDSANRSDMLKYSKCGAVDAFAATKMVHDLAKQGDL